ncbi:hypothetical protein, partial [Roseisolibacter sp. H3M3-2]|uniref:hypothetical protein n=1 Tax=Roseisolibacter sp. H3M3-2 TaxID=3031323 RepID=UPI0023D996BC
GSWARARWAPRAALGYGVVTAAMLGALPWILRLPADAHRGVRAGAAAVLLLSAALAWYLRGTLGAPRPPRRDRGGARAV